MNIQEEFVKLQKKMTELSEGVKRMLSDYSDGLHKTSTDRIDTQAGGISDLGDAVGDSTAGMDDLATTIADLVERVSALEQKEASNG